MKTMMKGDDIVRVPEDEQLKYIDSGYSYVPKKIWKERVRAIKEKKDKIRKNVKKSTDNG